MVSQATVSCFTDFNTNAALVLTDIVDGFLDKTYVIREVLLLATLRAPYFNNGDQAPRF